MIKISNKLQRYLLIVPYAVAQQTIKVKELAEMLNISEKNLLADFNKIQMCGVPDYGPGSLIDPYIDDSEQLTMYYADYFSRPVRLTPNEAIAILHALSLFKKISKAAVSLETILSLEGKIKKCLPEKLVERIYDAKGLIKFEKFQGPVADALYEGCSNMCSVEIEYIAQDGSKTRRTIDPLSIICFHGKWYVIAYCHLRKAMRMFLFRRIVEASNTSRLFNKPVDYKPEDYIYALFYPTKKDIKVRLRFSTKLAKMVEENWSAKQIEKNVDGSLIVTLYTKSFSWLLGLLLDWGASVKVLEPAELRDQLLKLVCDKTE